MQQQIPLHLLLLEPWVLNLASDHGTRRGATGGVCACHGAAGDVLRRCLRVGRMGNHAIQSAAYKFHGLPIGWSTQNDLRVHGSDMFASPKTKARTQVHRLCLGKVKGAQEMLMFILKNRKRVSTDSVSPKPWLHHWRTQSQWTQQWLKPLLCLGQATRSWRPDVWIVQFLTQKFRYLMPTYYLHPFLIL